MTRNDSTGLQRVLAAGRRCAFSAMGAFVITFCALRATSPSPGGTVAHAQVQLGSPSRADDVVTAFQPALPQPGHVAPASTTLASVDVSATLSSSESGQPVIAVSFENPGRRSTTVSCRVGLTRLVRGPTSPMARIVPPPRVEELFSEMLRISVPPGERVQQIVALPSDIELGSAGTATPTSSGNRARVASSNLSISIEPVDVD